MEGKNKKCCESNIVPIKKKRRKKMSSAILQFSKQAAADKELATEFVLYMQENTEVLLKWLARKCPDLSAEDRLLIAQNKYTVRDDESLTVGNY